MVTTSVSQTSNTQTNPAKITKGSQLDNAVDNSWDMANLLW